MSDIFKIISAKKEGKDTSVAFSLGIKIKIGKIDTVCSITEFLSQGDLISEIDSLRNELADIIKKLESFSKGNADQGFSGIGSDTPPQEIWELLLSVMDNSQFIEIFNSLDEPKRRELADHIFANCNMFTGRGAFFSACYVQETALLSV